MLRLLPGRARGAVRAALDRAERAQAARRISRYVRGGRIPWSVGYWEQRGEFVRRVLADPRMLRTFARADPLPEGYGARLDERVVEYPWVFSRLSDAASLLLDVGSTLNADYLLDHPLVSRKRVLLYSLSLETVVPRQHVSYVWGDVRKTILRDEVFDEVVCISTLEHVGMDATRLYSRDPRFAEANPESHLDAVREIRRLLRPGGRLLLTVPYGRYENHGWLQQFDRIRIEAVVRAFDGAASSVTYYRYAADGWQVAEADECADGRYFDVHSGREFEEDYLPAARSVACLEAER